MAVALAPESQVACPKTPARRGHVRHGREGHAQDRQGAFVAVKVLEKKRMRRPTRSRCVDARRLLVARATSPWLIQRSPPAQRARPRDPDPQAAQAPERRAALGVVYTQKRIFLVMDAAARGELFLSHRARGPPRRGRGPPLLRPDHRRRRVPPLAARGAPRPQAREPAARREPQHPDRRLRALDALRAGQVLKHSCGSPCYAAPEMLTRVGQQMGYVGHPVDLWSCGVTLYAMLCGCLPFEHANTSSLYKKIIARTASRATAARATRATSSGGSSTPTRASGSPSHRSNRTMVAPTAAAPPAAARRRARAPRARRDREPRVLGARLVVARTARTPRLRGGDDGGGARRGAPHRRHRLVLPPPSQGDPRRAKGAGGHGAHGALTDAAARSQRAGGAARRPLGSRRQHERAARGGSGGAEAGGDADARGGARHARRPTPRRRASPARRRADLASPMHPTSSPAFHKAPTAGGRGARRRGASAAHGAMPSGGAYTPRGGDERSAAARLREAQRQHLLANAQQHAIDRAAAAVGARRIARRRPAAPPAPAGTRRRAPRRRRRRATVAASGGGRDQPVSARAHVARLARGEPTLPRARAPLDARANVCP